MKKISIILLSFISVLATAQDVKFGKIDSQILSQTQHPTDPEAAAAVLYREYKTEYVYSKSTDWFILVTEVFERIKIYNKNGLDAANKLVYLYVDNKDKEKIGSIKGFTYNLVGGKEEKTKLDGENIFQEKVTDFYNKASITPPNVKEGSVVDISYKVSSPFLWNIPELRFQEDIPVDKVVSEVVVPEYYIFKQHVKGMYPLTFNEKRSLRQVQLTGQASGDAGLETGVQQTRMISEKVSVNETTYYVSGENIPAMRDESFVSNIDNYRTAVRYELTGTKFYNSPYKMLSQTWNDVAKSMNEYENFGKQLSKTSYFKSDLARVTTGIQDTVQKAVAIFSHVKDKMNWNQEKRLYTDEGLEKAYEKGSGNSSEINLILTAMLREAGLQANPVLVSTRSHGIPIFPTQQGFNYVVVKVNTSKGSFLLDATEKFAVPNILPERAINWIGYMVKPDGTSESVNLTPKNPSKNVVYVSANLSPDGSASGKVRIQRFDQFAFNFRENHSKQNREQYLDYLENKGFNSDIVVDNYNLQNETDLSKPIIENFEFSKEDQCEIIGDKIYVSPLLFSARQENPFKLEKRDYPIDFSFPTESQYLITINIPEGYTLESVPESVAYELPEGIGSYQYNITSRGNQVQIKLTSSINAPLISSEGYVMIKNYYEQIVLKNKEPIVIKKI
jgi:hypothetical protein